MPQFPYISTDRCNLIRSAKNRWVPRTPRRTPVLRHPNFSKLIQGTRNLFPSFFLGLKAIFDFEVGITPAQIAWRQFGASFLGAYSGIGILGVTWISARSLWGALWDFFASLAMGNILFGVAGFLLAVPAIFSVPIAWIIAGSSKEESNC
jgi:hypothetical protein